MGPNDPFAEGADRSALVDAPRADDPLVVEAARPFPSLTVGFLLGSIYGVIAVTFGVGPALVVLAGGAAGAVVTGMFALAYQRRSAVLPLIQRLLEADAR